MHMSDALLSVAVGGTMAAASAGAIGYSIKKIDKEELSGAKLPMMGVMGAFVFAAQMINFTIPVTGSSGHIGGGILLAALLGPYPALITLASVLLIQCLFFADGGLLALGCNIFNMAVIPCLVVYPLIYKPIVRNKLTPGRISAAAVLSAIVSLQMGAFAVVLETLASGITQLPFSSFVALMQPIHLAIGTVEGIVTAGVLCFLYHNRRDVLEDALGLRGTTAGSRKNVLIIMAAMALLVGGVFSWFASSYPDGLEWSIEKVAGTTELDTDSGIHAAAGKLQESTAILPDYAFKPEGDGTADTNVPESSETVGSTVSGAGEKSMTAGAGTDEKAGTSVSGSNEKTGTSSVSGSNEKADTGVSGGNGKVGTSISGIVGGIFTLILAMVTGGIITAVKKLRKPAAAK